MNRAVFPSAILYFDYSLTFITEVQRFWTRHVSTASFIFFLNRYFTLLGHVPVMYEFYGAPDINV